jgi:hypothetical protein
MTILTNIAKWVDTFKFFLESDNCPPHDYPIVIWSSNNYPNKYILYNSEQLSSINKLNGFLSKINDSVIEIWDYSIENVKILAANGITARHVPPISPTWYKDKLKSYGANHIYDVGLAGCISERRNHIIDALRSHGVSVNYMQIYGEERDKALASCKILVNIHCFDDFAIFESARCEPWLSIGKSVISENSLDNDPRCINVDYHMLVQTVLNTLKGYT